MLVHDCMSDSVFVQEPFSPKDLVLDTALTSVETTIPRTKLNYAWMNTLLTHFRIREEVDKRAMQMERSKLVQYLLLADVRSKYTILKLKTKLRVYYRLTKTSGILNTHTTLCRVSNSYLQTKLCILT